MKTIWYVKRKPDGKYKFFRDAFPYLEQNMPTGSLWVDCRADAGYFKSLKAAQTAAKLARRFESHVVVVKVYR